MIATIIRWVLSRRNRRRLEREKRERCWWNNDDAPIWEAKCGR